MTLMIWLIWPDDCSMCCMAPDRIGDHRAGLLCRHRCLADEGVRLPGPAGGARHRCGDLADGCGCFFERCRLPFGAASKIIRGKLQFLRAAMQLPVLRRWSTSRRTNRSIDPLKLVRSGSSDGAKGSDSRSRSRRRTRHQDRLPVALTAKAISAARSARSRSASSSAARLMLRLLPALRAPAACALGEFHILVTARPIWPISSLLFD